MPDRYGMLNGISPLSPKERNTDGLKRQLGMGGVASSTSVIENKPVWMSNKVHSLIKNIHSDPDLSPEDKSFAYQGVMPMLSPQNNEGRHFAKSDDSYKQARLLSYKYGISNSGNPDELVKTAGFDSVTPQQDVEGIFNNPERRQVSTKIQDLANKIFSDPDVSEEQRKPYLEALMTMTRPNSEEDVAKIRGTDGYKALQMLMHKYNILNPNDPDNLLRTGGYEIPQKQQALNVMNKDPRLVKAAISNLSTQR